MSDTRVCLTHDPVRRLFTSVLVALFGAGVLVVTATPAQAAARLNASSSLGGAVASTSGPTTFTLSGSGFQAIQGGFGGIYVGFGWVNGSNWGPSKGGSTGSTYDYVPDDQSKNNQGYQTFVTFPGSETAGEAQGTMSADGSFRVQMTVPGPKFTGAGGKSIDCAQVTCGFFTWGAHGVRNGANEVFTPVTFQGGAAPAEAPGEPADSEAEAGAGPAASGGGTAATNGRAGGGRAAAAGGRGQNAAQVQGQAPASAAVESGGASRVGDAPTPEGENAAPAEAPGGTRLSGAALIEVDRKSARAGGAMGFAAAGFWPGEQVYVVLGDGVAAVGPVVAGVDGEVAGVIVLPDDLEPGTHEVRAAGAGSGLEATERFPLRVDIAQASSSTSLRDSVKWVFLALAALALLAAGTFLIKRRQDSAADRDDADGYGTDGDGYGMAGDGYGIAGDAAPDPGEDPDSYYYSPDQPVYADSAYPTTSTMQEEVQR